MVCLKFMHRKVACSLSTVSSSPTFALQARHLGSVAEARVCELVEQLALKELEFSKLSVSHEEQARLQVDLMAELEKAVAEKRAQPRGFGRCRRRGPSRRPRWRSSGRLRWSC